MHLAATPQIQVVAAERKPSVRTPRSCTDRCSRSSRIIACRGSSATVDAWPRSTHSVGLNDGGANKSNGTKQSRDRQKSNSHSQGTRHEGDSSSKRESRRVTPAI